MEKNTLSFLNLEDLRQKIDFLTYAKTALMCDCAVMQLHGQGHVSGVELQLTTKVSEEVLSLVWSTKIDKNLIESTNDEEFTTEWAAMGVGILLTRKMTDYPFIRRARKEGGFDFGLSKSGDAFTFDAHLEISGIKKANRNNNLESRLREKKKQIKSTNIPTFIVITEFSIPKSLFIEQ